MQCPSISIQYHPSEAPASSNSAKVVQIICIVQGSPLFALKMFLFLFCKSAKLRQACAVSNWSDRVHSSGSRQESRRAHAFGREEEEGHVDRKEVNIFPPPSFFPAAIFAGKVIVFAVMHRSWPQIDRNTRASRSMSKRAISPTDRGRSPDGPPSPSRSVNDFSGAARRAGGGESSLPPPAVVTPFRERGSSSLACGSGSEKKFRKVKKEGEEEEKESAYKETIEDTRDR